MKIYINGKFYDKENARISVFDHGLLYGDGVFEGIRSYNRRVFKLKEHIDRLFESAQSIMLKIPLTKEQLIKAVVQTIKANKLDNAYIRLVVTRGEGDLGLDPRKCHKGSTVIIIADRIALYPEKLYREGLTIVTVPTVRNLPEALNPQIKSLNYLNNILAKIEQVMPDAMRRSCWILWVMWQSAPGTTSLWRKTGIFTRRRSAWGPCAGLPVILSWRSPVKIKFPRMSM